jgi:hypothetical protein
LRDDLRRCRIPGRTKDAGISAHWLRKAVSFTINLQGGSPHGYSDDLEGQQPGSTQPSMLLAIFGPTTWPA